MSGANNVRRARRERERGEPHESNAAGERKARGARAAQRVRGAARRLGRRLWAELDVAMGTVGTVAPTAPPGDAAAALARLANMVQIPLHLEHFMAFGLLVCLHALLTVFTVVPLRLAVAAARRARGAPTAMRGDGVTVSLILISLAVLLLPYFDVSRLYHDVRGLAHIKLYVMFGVLEVADRLFSTVGQDLLGVLYAAGAWRRRVAFGALSALYLSCHAYILIYQAVALNVAANLYSNALLALLLSNQFLELKGLVFKKFEREGLFQIAMLDLAERFQLSLMLGVIALRNLAQVQTLLGVVPTSWASWNRLGGVAGPSVVVVGSEIAVDWLKHCYICRFNGVTPGVYGRFLCVMGMDYLEVVPLEPAPEPKATAWARTSEPQARGAPEDRTREAETPEPHALEPEVMGTAREPQALQVAEEKTIEPMLDVPEKPTVAEATTTAGAAAAATADAAAPLAPPPSPSPLALPDYITLTRRTGLPLLATVVCFLRMALPDLRLLLPLPTLIATLLRLPLYLLAFCVLLLLRLLLGLQLARWAAAMAPPAAPAFLPGVPNAHPATINPSTRAHLYDAEVPPSPEERRDRHFARENLDKVMRYQMASKRIW